MLNICLSIPKTFEAFSTLSCTSNILCNKGESGRENEKRLPCLTFTDWISPPRSNKNQVVGEFIQWTLLSFLCTIARQSKCRTNKNQSLPIDMHWMFSHCSDRDASPNSGLEITRRPGCVCWRGGKAARDGRSPYWYEACQVLLLPLLLLPKTM